VDALSHALIASILFSLPGLAPLIPFAILGAVIPDADIFFSAIADRDPSLYLFTHGGIAHSIAGVFVLSLLAYGATVLVAAAGSIPAGVITGAGVYGFAAVLAGAVLHVAIDATACPGIPILAPFSDRKYTPGILPGPSVLLAGAALWLVVVTVLRLLPFSLSIVLYGGTVIIYLAFRIAMFLFATAILPGLRVPTINPFRWLVITEDDTAFTVRYYTVFSGFSESDVIEMFRNTNACEVEPYLNLANVRRLRFYSWIITAEKDNAAIVFRDPLREKGYVWYPHKFRQVSISMKDAM